MGYENFALNRQLINTDMNLIYEGSKIEDKYAENGTRTTIFDKSGNYTVSYDEDGNGKYEKEFTYDAISDISFERYIDNETGELSKIYSNKDGERKLISGNESILDKIKNLFGVNDKLTVSKDEVDAIIKNAVENGVEIQKSFLETIDEQYALATQQINQNNKLQKEDKDNSDKNSDIDLEKKVKELENQIKQLDEVEKDNPFERELPKYKGIG